MVIPMNETIGEKGGKNDRRRTMIIKKEQKKKLEAYEEEREIAELEKRVKKKQFYTLIKTLPIVIGGGTIQTLYDVSVGKRREDKEEENSRWRIKEYDADISPVSIGEEQAEKRRKIITTPTGEKIVIYVTTPVEEKVSTNPSNLKQDEESRTKDTVSYEKPKTSGVSSNPSTNGSLKEEKSKSSTSNPSGGKPSVGIGDQQIDVEAFIDQEISSLDFDSLSPDAKAKLEKLKSHKIVEEYERQLKDIRFELRRIIYEYNVLVDENDEVVLSHDAEIILDRLSGIIDRIEELKRKIRIEDLDKYDDNYIYYLIEGYLKDFHDGKVISEIQDSPLYVMLSEKLDELDAKRGKFQKSVEDKKDALEVKEDEFDRLKDRYYSIDRLNNQLLEFQAQQDFFLKEIQEKVRNATTETERVTEEFQGLNMQSRRLLRMLSFQMFLPGPRFARGLAASAAAYLYFMNNVIHPNTVTRRYRVITVKDYHNDIQNSIDALDDAMSLLGKTSKQIDKMISELEERYHDYLGKVSECDELLRNLRKVKSEVEEKEYEMERLKKQQELELEKNDAKVKTIGEYPVN